MTTQKNPPSMNEMTRRMVDIPGLARQIPERRKTAALWHENLGEGRQLIVGRDIFLTGDIQDCDTLVVEGTLEATLSDAASVFITETGLYKGTADVESAEIGGEFQGTLTVRKRLTVTGTGRIEGEIRYHELSVEAGGRLIGTVEPIDGDSDSTEVADEKEKQPGKGPGADPAETPKAEPRINAENQGQTAAVKAQ